MIGFFYSILRAKPRILKKDYTGWKHAQALWEFFYVYLLSEPWPYFSWKGAFHLGEHQLEQHINRYKKKSMSKMFNKALFVKWFNPRKSSQSECPFSQSSKGLWVPQSDRYQTLIFTPPLASTLGNHMLPCIVDGRSSHTWKTNSYARCYAVEIQRIYSLWPS